jgi:hypothetical protein
MKIRVAKKIGKAEEVRHRQKSYQAALGCSNGTIGAVKLQDCMKQPDTILVSEES